MLNVFQSYVLWSIKVHGLDYDFTIDHNFYQYQMPCLMHSALNFILFIFHIAILFLLVPIFLIYLCFRFNRAREDGIMSLGMGGTEFFVTCFVPVSSLWQYKHGIAAHDGKKVTCNSPGCSDPVLLAKQNSWSQTLAEKTPEKLQSGECS